MAERRNGSLDPVPRASTAALSATLTAEAEARSDEVTASTDATAVYDVQSEHGRGGIGRVLRARDLRLERTVAIKELLRRGNATEQRFLHEAKITARLQHPGVVPIYEAGRWPDGTPYYVMKLVLGRTLRELIVAAETFDERLALVPKLIAVAETVAYAHSEHIVHRDLKPANVIVGAFGEIIVIDWGLAKDLTDSDDAQPDGGPYRAATLGETAEGTVLGTPSYMPPEQARGLGVDERADVYALGAMLYHALGGHPPYAGATSAEIIEQALHATPRPLEERQSGIPRELNAIVVKAMQRDPEKRYRDAGELAADLARFHKGQLVRAHVYTSRQLALRWLRRHRTPVAISSAFLAAFIVVGALAVRQVVRARDRAEARSNEMILMQARGSLDRDATAALAWLKTYPRNGTEWPASREIVMRALNARPARTILHRDDKWLPGAAFSSDGSKLVCVETGHRVSVRDAMSGRVVAQVRYDGRPSQLAFIDSDGAILFSDGKSVRRWDLRTGGVDKVLEMRSSIEGMPVSRDGRFVAVQTEGPRTELFTWKNRALRSIASSAAWPFDFSSDSRRAVMTDAGGRIDVRELASSRIVASFGPTGAAVLLANLSRDGEALSVLRSDGQLSLCRVSSGDCRPLRGHEGATLSDEFAAAAEVVASSGRDRTVRVWSAATGAQLAYWQTERELFIIAVSPDGKKVVARANDATDATLYLFDVETREVSALRGHSGLVEAVVSPTGRLLMSSGYDRTTRLWTLAASPCRLLGRHDDQVQSVTVSADRTFVASASRDHTVRSWDLASGKETVFRQPSSLMLRAAISADGERMAAVGFERIVHLWNFKTGEYRPLSGHTDIIWAIAFSPNGGRLASAGDDGTIRLWTAQGAPERVLTGHRDAVRSIAFSPDGSTLASASADHTVRLWNVANGSLVKTLTGHRDVVANLAFVSHGAQLVSASWDGSVLLWNRESGAVKSMGADIGPITALATSADGRFVAAGSVDRVTRLWDLQTGTEHLLRGHRERIQALAFSPDGRQLATASADRTVRRWSTSDGSLLAILQHAAPIMTVAYSSNDGTVISGDNRGDVRVWPADRTPLVPTDPALLSAFVDAQTDAVVEDFEP